MDVNEVIALINTAPIGAQIVYHTGNLSIDRGARKDSIKREKFRSYDEDSINFLATEVYKLYLDGVIDLLQRRRIENKKPTYEYIAVKLDPLDKIRRALINHQLHEDALTSKGL